MRRAGVSDPLQGQFPTKRGPQTGTGNGAAGALLELGPNGPWVIPESLPCLRLGSRGRGGVDLSGQRREDGRVIDRDLRGQRIDDQKLRA
eukprot:3266890-Pyramimonas_sp.AAC.1